MKFGARTLLIGSLAGALCLTSASAQDTTIHSRYNLSVASSANMENINPHKNGLSRQDISFLVDAARVNMAEVQFGQLAQQNGDQWAKAYGKDMEREHSIALEELKKLAVDKGVSLPHDVDVRTTRIINRLKSVHGAQFDGMYKRMMIAGHSGVLPVVQKEIHYGHDADVRGYAVKLEPAVKLHLKMAQQQTTMMGPNG